MKTTVNVTASNMGSYKHKEAATGGPAPGGFRVPSLGKSKGLSTDACGRIKKHLAYFKAVSGRAHGACGFLSHRGKGPIT